MAIVCTKPSYYRFSGLSTDIKPIIDIEEGSVFWETDTGDEYEIRNKVWYKREVTLSITQPSYTLRMDESVSPYLYVGEAEPGSSESASVWRIKRIDDTAIMWANGLSTFVNRWDRRTLLNYTGG